MRDIGAEAVIHQPSISAADANFFDAYIFSGGPSSASEMKPNAAHRILRAAKEGKIRKPILGICLGHQLIAHELGGKIGKGASAEYGVGEIEVDKEGILLAGMPKKFRAWVSHFDEVKQMPPGFVALAHSQSCKFEAMENSSLSIFGLQFHPEVWHTENGEKILENFAKTIKAQK
jgi:GMP synthase (glutamine-hydrolysing)